MADETEKPYLSLEEVADLLSVNYQLIYRLVRSGELPAVRLGRVYRIERSDLDEYLESAKTISGGVCSSCGKTYSSRLSLKQKCTECGAPICTDCWDRKNLHLCREHSKEDSE